MQRLEAIPELDHQRKRLSDASHQQTNETSVLDLTESSFDSKHACPHCTNIQLYRHGVVNGLQRYYCQYSHNTFNQLTGSLLVRLREKLKWFIYLATYDNATQDRAATRRRHRRASKH